MSTATIFTRGPEIPNRPEEARRLEVHRLDAGLVESHAALLAACEAALPHHQGGHSTVGRLLRDAIAKAKGGA